MKKNINKDFKKRNLNITISIIIFLCLLLMVIIFYINSNKLENKIKQPIDLIGSGISGLSYDLVGGLYRFQGISQYTKEQYPHINEPVVANYICFGTHSKDECLKNTARYMYRIIGLDNNGRMKLIKDGNLLSKIEEVDWRFTYRYEHSSWVKDISWVDSTMYSSLNGDKFLYDEYYFEDSKWIDKIIDYEWKYGTMSKEEINMDEFDFLDGDYFYELEEKWESSVVAKIGLISVSDYYYSPSGNKFGLIKNDALYYNGLLANSWIGKIEMTITNGICFDQFYEIQLDNTVKGRAYRPVFWVDSNIYFSSGNGEEESPFVIK